MVIPSLAPHRSGQQQQLWLHDLCPLTEGPQLSILTLGMARDGFMGVMFLIRVMKML